MRSCTDWRAGTRCVSHRLVAMFLRAAIVILVTLNLAAAAWWLARPATGADARAQAAIAPDVPRLVLLDEAAPASTPAPMPEAVEAQVDGSGERPAAVPAPAPAAAATCLRFGPFADAAARDAVRATLAAAGLSAIARETPARAGRGWKVWMPPLDSREAATAMAERIKAAGVTDLYVLSQGGDANGIALGRFGGEEAARRREAELHAKGFTGARAVALDGAPAQAWLDARLPGDAHHSAIAGVAPSRAIDCAGLP